MNTHRCGAHCSCTDGRRLYAALSTPVARGCERVYEPSGPYATTRITINSYGQATVRTVRDYV